MAILFALVGVGAESQSLAGTALQPTNHQLEITIRPGLHQAQVRDVITVPAEDVKNEGVTFELANFIARPQFRIVSGAHKVTVRSRQGDFGRLWTIKPLGVSNEPLKIEAFYTIDQPKSAQIVFDQKGSFAGSSGDTWYPQVDYAVPESGRITFHVPAGETVIATGALISSPAQAQRGEFVYDMVQPGKFAFAAAHYYRYQTGDGRFSVFALHKRPELKSLSRQLGPSLETLTSMYGPFPFGPPALVEVKFPTIVLGASERGFILTDSSQIVAHSGLYWVHEFAHQWWGSAVKPQAKTPAGTLLTEGMAEFSALEVLEKLKGAEALRKFRVGQLVEEGESPIEAYGKLAARNQDRSLRDWTPANGDEALLMHRFATSKGAQVLSMLLHNIGDDRVVAALRDLINRNLGGNISWADIEQSFSSAAGRDLGKDFAEWLGRPGIADLQLHWSQAADNGEVTGTIVQNGLTYEMPIEVELRGSATSGRATREKLELNGGETAFRSAPGFEVREIRLDPDYRIFRHPLPSDLH